MPPLKNQNFRIKIIDDLLSHYKWVTTARMKKIIDERLDIDIALRTVQDDVHGMMEGGKLKYDAPIEYNRKLKAYRYTEEGYSINNFKLSAHEIDALRFYAECLQAFSGYKLFNAFTSGIDKVINGVKARRELKPSSDAKMILQTDSLVTAGGDEYITDLVYAIDNKQICEITYQPFGKRSGTRKIIPLFLREYKNRWYLLCSRLDIKEIRTYALDRIKSCMVTEESAHKLPVFDPENYFNHSFGITTPNAKVETIILRFSGDHVPYVLSLPAHKTQKIINRTSISVTISISVILSYEVFEFILSKSPDVKVLAPAHLAEKVAALLRKSAEQYKSSKKVIRRR